MATGGCEQTSDEIFNFKCTPCAKKKRNREAVKYCVECQGYCCESCVDIHESFPALEGHQLLDKSDFNSTTLTTDLPEIPTVRCKIHKVKVMDMYCGNHDMVACTSCIAINHRTCSHVSEVENIVNTVFKKSDAESFSEILQEKVKKLEKIIKERVSFLDDLNQSKVEAVKAIKAFRKELESILEKLERLSIKEVENLYKEKKAVLDKEKKQAEEELLGVKQAESDLKNSEANKAQQFVHMKLAQLKATKADEVINSLRVLTDAKIHFLEDTDLQNSLSRMQSLGSVQMSAFISLEPRKSVYQITDSKDLNIRLQTDKSVCHVLGPCLTKSDILLLCDYNNKNLKRVDVATRALVDSCDFNSKPCSVCVTNKQEAAVTLYSKSIQFVSLGNKMTRTRQLQLGHDCHGIAYKEDKLYITDHGHNVYVHNMTGQLLQTMSKDLSGNSLFSQSRNIAFNDIRNKLFVNDWDKGLIILDNHGNYISTYSNTDLLYASGMCTDRRGTVFVCGYGSHNVVQIGEDGKKIGEVAQSSDGLSSPLSVCFAPKQQVLIVSQARSDIVKFLYLQ